jgi:hypothetical protein
LTLTRAPARELVGAGAVLGSIVASAAVALVGRSSPTADCVTCPTRTTCPFERQARVTRVLHRRRRRRPVDDRVRVGVCTQTRRVRRRRVGCARASTAHDDIRG